MFLNTNREALGKRSEVGRLNYHMQYGLQTIFHSCHFITRWNSFPCDVRTCSACQPVLSEVKAMALWGELAHMCCSREQYIPSNFKKKRWRDRDFQASSPWPTRWEAIRQGEWRPLLWEARGSGCWKEGGTRRNLKADRLNLSPSSACKCTLSVNSFLRLCPRQMANMRWLAKEKRKIRLNENIQKWWFNKGCYGYMINDEATAKNHFSKCVFFLITIILIAHVTVKRRQCGFRPNTSDKKCTDKRNRRTECRKFTIRNDSKRAEPCH